MNEIRWETSSPPPPFSFTTPPVTPPSGFRQPCLLPQFSLQSFLKIIFPQDNPVIILLYSLSVLLHFLKTPLRLRQKILILPQRNVHMLSPWSASEDRPFLGLREKHLCSNCFWSTGHWQMSDAQQGSSSEKASCGWQDLREPGHHSC